MTTTPTAQADLRPTPSSRALHATGVLALLAGGALVVDTVTITAINDTFDPLDSILFLIGLAGTLVTAIALALHVSSGRRGAARLTSAVGAFLATGVVLGVVSTASDAVGRHVFSSSNRGLHGEWSFFSIGVCLLLLAAWTRRRA